MQKQKQTKRQWSIFTSYKLAATTAIVALVAVFIAPLAIPSAQAAAFTQAYLRIDRMKASTTTGGTVCAKPATTGTEVDVQVVFPTGFTVNSTAANWTVTTTNLPAGATAWVGIGTATAVSSQTVTFASGDVVVGTLYCFNFSGTSTLTTSTAGSNKTGTITSRATGAATIDTTSYATAVISDDQVVVTATVPAIFSFALGANSTPFGDLSSSSVTSATGVSVTVNTNAESGWIAWLKSANQGIDSATTGTSVDTGGTIDDACTTLTNGSNFYQLDVDLTTDAAGGGTVTIDPEYNCAATTGGTFSSNFQEIATASGPSAGDIVTLNGRATITAIQAAASDYTDTWTIVGAGNF